MGAAARAMVGQASAAVVARGRPRCQVALQPDSVDVYMARHVRPVSSALERRLLMWFNSFSNPAAW